MQRVAKALGGDPYHIRYTDGLGGTGLQSARLIPVAGGFGGGAPTAEGTPFEISTNPRTAAALDALSDINSNVDFTGGLTAIRDMSDAAAYMNELQARGAVDRVKSLFRKDLINPPTESQLGALPNYVKNESGEAVQVYDQNDLLQRFLGAYRMSLLERQGAIELDHDHWKIKSIGNTKLTPEQFVKEFGSRYQSAFADSVQEADRNLAAGVRPLGDNVALPIQRGYMADQGAKRAASTYLNSIGVPEGPGQVVALNRRAYYQDGSGLHARPDVLIDAGIPHRHILDGKATKFEDLSPPMRSQLGGYHDLGVDTVEGVTQHGSVPIPREETPRRRR